MNKSALRALLFSSIGYARTMTGHRMATRHGVAVVKNRHNKPVMTIFYTKTEGFSYYTKQGVMCRRMVWAELRLSANV